MDQIASPRIRAHPAARTPWLRHLCYLGPLLIVSVAGFRLSLPTSLAGLTPLRLLYAAAVALNVAYIGVSWCTVLGVVATALRRWRGSEFGPVLKPPSGAARTAVLLPVFEEDAARVFARAAVISDEIANACAPGSTGALDIFVLSDTASPEGAAAEERAAAVLRPQGRPPIFYRRRTERPGRKAGNLAEWIGRWGGAYDFAVILDADSLMTGPAIARLVGAMEANPNAGLIQAMCYPIGCNTLFARIQQFSARVYGPLFQRGVALWQGPRGNFWGHNAIVRTAAFASSCGLPRLPGKPPVGGEIISHDTVEAALMLRAGWDVWMLPEGTTAHHGGSWEETPTNWLDYLARDRRWCQGNLQHIAVLAARGLRPASYYHLVRGLSHYLYVVPAIAWLALFATIDRGPTPDAALLALVATLVAVPRVLAFAATWMEGAAAFGGRLGFTASFLLDQLAAVLQLPLLLVFHTLLLGLALSGKPIRWDAQARGDRALTWGQAARALRMPTGFRARGAGPARAGRPDPRDGSRARPRAGDPDGGLVEPSRSRRPCAATPAFRHAGRGRATPDLLRARRSRARAGFTRRAAGAVAAAAGRAGPAHAGAGFARLTPCPARARRRAQAAGPRSRRSLERWQLRPFPHDTTSHRHPHGAAIHLSHAGSDQDLPDRQEGAR